MSMDDNVGQMIFGDFGGLKLPDICPTGIYVTILIIQFVYKKSDVREVFACVKNVSFITKSFYDSSASCSHVMHILRKWNSLSHVPCYGFLFIQ